jgi:hypothetical protein
VEGSADYPDVVIGTALPSWWDSSGVGLAMLGSLSFLDAGDLNDPDAGRRADSALWPRAGRTVILTRAPHPERARAFVVWLRDEGGCLNCWKAPDAKDKAIEAPVRVAMGALAQVLQGGGMGESADPDAAHFSADLARRLALTPPSPAVLDGLHFRMDVMQARANERLAVVSLRAIGSSEQAFGIVHAVAVLRRDANRRWKVLQISPNMSLRSVGTAWGVLGRFTDNAPPAHLAGISQAAPPDGDYRQPQPDLWWDNAGNAGLLAIEWQTNLGGWTDPRLMLVSDSNPRLQTRVTATFARNPGEYRWRVWSVGAGGVVVLSPWKRLLISR